MSQRHCETCGSDKTARDLGRARAALRRAAEAVAAADDAIDAYLAGTAKRLAKRERTPNRKGST